MNALVPIIRELRQCRKLFADHAVPGRKWDVTIAGKQEIVRQLVPLLRRIINVVPA